MYNPFKHLKNKVVAATAAATAIVMGNSVAFAALTAAQQAVVDSTNTLITDLMTMGWGLVLAVTGGLVGVKLFKKVFNKTT